MSVACADNIVEKKEHNPCIFGGIYLLYYFH